MKWEYTVLKTDADEDCERLTEEMNAFGNDGWELVAVVQPRDENLPHLICTFKRRRE
jgi:Domain of unknown function (DUF4177)